MSAKKPEDVKEFFSTLGEVWRDITAIEFLMRAALSHKRGDISKWPKPPYNKGRIYKDYPESFKPTYFESLAKKFNKEFPKLAIPQELIDLRNAMAHGLIAEIDHGGVDELIKFRKQEDGTLKIEFSMTLETKRINQIKQSLKEIRRYIAIEAADKKPARDGSIKSKN